MKFDKIAIIIFAVSALMAVAIYPFLPDQIPLQWSTTGAVSRYGSRNEIFLIALLPTVIYLSVRYKYRR